MASGHRCLVEYHSTGDTKRLTYASGQQPILKSNLPRGARFPASFGIEI